MRSDPNYCAVTHVLQSRNDLMQYRPIAFGIAGQAVEDRSYDGVTPDLPALPTNAERGCGDFMRQHAAASDVHCGTSSAPATIGRASCAQRSYALLAHHQRSEDEHRATVPRVPAVGTIRLASNCRVNTKVVHAVPAFSAKTLPTPVVASTPVHKNLSLVLPTIL